MTKVTLELDDELTRAKCHDWESLPLPYKWGTFIKKDGHAYFGRADYHKMSDMADIR